MCARLLVFSLDPKREIVAAYKPLGGAALQLPIPLHVHTLFSF